MTRGSGRHSLAVLMTATGFAIVADAMFALGLAWLLATTDRAPLLGALLACLAATRLVLLPVGGVVADRMDRVVLLRVSALVRLLAMPGVAWSVEVDRLIYAFALVVILGAATALHYPADRAVVVDIVPAEGLTKANSGLQTVMNLGNIGGPALAGGLITVVGPAQTLALAGVAYGLGLLTLMFLSTPERQRAQQEPGGRWWTELVGGVRYALSRRGLGLLLLVLAGMNLGFVGPFAIALPVFVAEELRSPALVLAILEMSFAGGAILGAVLAGALALLSRGPFVLSAVLATAVGMILVALSPSPIRAALAILAAGTASGVANVVIVTAIQQQTDTAYMGRVMSLVMLVSMGLVPVSQALTGTLISVVDASQVLLAGAALSLVIGLIGAPVLLRVQPPRRASRSV